MYTTLRKQIQQVAITLTFAATFVLLSTMPAAAQGVQLKNPMAVNSIQELLEALIGIIIVFATPIIIFFIVYAGFLYVTARGNEQTITQANRALLYAIIGGLLILGAFALITIITNLISAVATTPTPTP